jgi:hypothetical protein
VRAGQAVVERGQARVEGLGERDVPRVVCGDAVPEFPRALADRARSRLLVQCAHDILGPFGEDCDLRRWGPRLAGEGSRSRKKKAVVAVARKLAVLLHHLCVSGERYEPLHHSQLATAA